MRARIRALFDGAGWFVGSAIVLFCFTLIMVLGELQSADVVLWTGHHIVGTEERGLVFFRWHGQEYTVDAPGRGSSNAVSVYFDPADPSNAMVDNLVNRGTAVLLIGVPFTGGVALIAAGLTRGYRSKRQQFRKVVPPGGYGHGLDPEFVAKRLRELRDKKSP